MELTNADYNNILPSVSIVVPVYNGELTIGKCLKSIMSLEYPADKVEVIVVDDGSTDKTVDIIKEFPVKVVQIKHSGYPSAMNNGIKVASGEIIVNIDSDTYPREDWLIKVVGEFRDPKVGIASGYVATVPTSSFWAKLSGFECEDRYDRIESKYVDFITSTCTAYRKELFIKVGLFDEKIPWNCDEELAHRAVKADWKIVLRKDAILYHDWSPSFVKSFWKQVITGRFAVNMVLKHSELLSGKKFHPMSFYIPLALTSLVILTPILFFVNLIWLSVLSSLGLFLYHIPQTVRIVRKHRDWSMLFFPVAINVRYVAWLMGFIIGIVGIVNE